MFVMKYLDNWSKTTLGLLDTRSVPSNKNHTLGNTNTSIERLFQLYLETRVCGELYRGVIYGNL